MGRKCFQICLEFAVTYKHVTNNDRIHAKEPWEQKESYLRLCEGKSTVHTSQRQTYPHGHNKVIVIAKKLLKYIEVVSGKE